jgi:transcriptional regulator with XRE-family HTH domain
MIEESDKEIKTFLKNIIWLRKNHGISKKEMSKILHISIVTINKIESGILPLKLSANIIWRIKLHFGVSPSDQFLKELWKYEQSTPPKS